MFTKESNILFRKVFGEVYAEGRKQSGSDSANECKCLSTEGIGDQSENESETEDLEF